MDEIDSRVIELFASEPRLGVLEASRRLGIARGTVQARLDKLTAAGVITGWGPDLSPEAIGYPVMAFLTLEIRQGAGHDAVARHLAEIREVLEAYTITGAGDMWARVVARSNADLQRVIDLVLDDHQRGASRHRLSRAGNRKANHVIHIAAACQIRVDGPGRAYYRRKLAAGKTRREAMRCLKRRISDALYRQLVADAQAARLEGVDAGPGGHRGASLISSAAGSHPPTGTSDQPLPGPAPTTLPAATVTRKSKADRPLESAS